MIPTPSTSRFGRFAVVIGATLSLLAGQAQPAMARDWTPGERLPYDSAQNGNKPLGPRDLADTFYNNFNPAVLHGIPVQTVYTQWGSDGYTNPSQIPLCGRDQVYDTTQPITSEAYTNTFVNADAWGVPSVHVRGQGRPVYRVNPGEGQHVSQCEFWPTRHSNGATGYGAGQLFPGRFDEATSDRSFARNEQPPGMYVMYENGRARKAYNLIPAPQIILTVDEATPQAKVYGYAPSKEAFAIKPVSGNDYPDPLTKQAPSFDDQVARYQVGTRRTQATKGNGGQVDYDIQWGPLASISAVNTQVNGLLNQLDPADPHTEIYVRADQAVGADPSAIQFLTANDPDFTTGRRYTTVKVVYHDQSFASQLNQQTGGHGAAVALQAFNEDGLDHTFQFAPDAAYHRVLQSRGVYATTRPGALLGQVNYVTTSQPTRTPRVYKLIYKLAGTTSLPASGYHQGNVSSLKTSLPGELVELNLWANPGDMTPNREALRMPTYSGQDERYAIVTAYDFGDTTAYDAAYTVQWGGSRYGSIHVPQELPYDRTCELVGVCDDSNFERYTRLGTGEIPPPRRLDPDFPTNPFYGWQGQANEHLSSDMFVPDTTSVNLTAGDAYTTDPNWGAADPSYLDKPFSLRVTHPQVGWINYAPYRSGNFRAENNSLPYHAYVPYTVHDPDTGMKKTFTVFYPGRQMLWPNSVQTNIDSEGPGTEHEQTIPIYTFCNECRGGDLNSYKLPNGLNDAYAYEGIPPGMRLEYDGPLDELGREQVVLRGKPTRPGDYTLKIVPIFKDVTAPIEPINITVLGTPPPPPPKRPEKPFGGREPRDDELMSIRY